MIQCYYGNGKGKTTAAVGQALRMAGADKKVLFLQFLKDGDSSEIKMLKKCGIKVLYAKMPQMFIDMHDPEMIKLVSRLEDELFEQIDESYEGIVLDEILDAIALNLLNEGKVYDCLVSLKETHEVILTANTTGGHRAQHTGPSTWAKDTAPCSCPWPICLCGMRCRICGYGWRPPGWPAMKNRPVC